MKPYVKVLKFSEVEMSKRSCFLQTVELSLHVNFYKYQVQIPGFHPYHPVFRTFLFILRADFFFYLFNASFPRLRTNTGCVCVCGGLQHHLSVYVFVCPCQCMLFLLSPLAVCVCVIIQRGPL